MPVTDLMHINIRAPRELAMQLREFYREAIGLIEGARPPFRSEGFWMYAGARPLVHLVIAEEEHPADATTHTTLDHLAFGCADFESMRRSLDARGVKYVIREVPMLRQRQIFCHDPAGNGVELLFAETSHHV